MQDYSSDSVVTVTPQAATEYVVRVKAKDPLGNIANKDMNFTVVKKPVNVSTLSSTSVTLGQSVSAVCSAENGTGPYTYAVFYRQTKQSKWTCAQNYSENSVVSITPKAATSYYVGIKLKDKYGNISNKDFLFTVNPKPVNKSAVSSDKIELGESVTVNCDCEGGTAPYTYAVYYKLSNKKNYTRLCDYNENKTVVFTPSEAGTYNIRVKMKDASGKIVNKDFKLKVCDI